jgi:hypothetical protein
MAIPTHVIAWMSMVDFHPDTFAHIVGGDRGEIPGEIKSVHPGGSSESASHSSPRYPKVAQADFGEHIRQRAFTAWKYAMWDAGGKMPTQMADGRLLQRRDRSILKRQAGHVYAAHLEMR